MTFLLFDTETTGLLRPSVVPLDQQPQIIELGLLVVNVEPNCAPTHQAHNWLLDPGVPIPKEITKITGITDENVHRMPKFAEIVEEIRPLFLQANAVVCHNASFDIGMLSNELKRCDAFDGFPIPKTVICTVQEFFPRYGRRMKLTQLYADIMQRPLEQTHRAVDDCLALLEILTAANYFENVMALTFPDNNLDRHNEARVRAGLDVVVLGQVESFG